MKDKDSNLIFPSGTTLNESGSLNDETGGDLHSFEDNIAALPSFNALKLPKEVRNSQSQSAPIPVPLHSNSF